MADIFARKVLLQKGWADNARLRVAAGHIEAIETEATARKGDVTAGIVIPGLCNAHSHAFQRALAGRTEERSPAARDNFWSWRERMYELASRLDAEALGAIARQAYTEMLESGFTAVAEFHYLHRPASGEHGDAMFNAIADAANASGIRLTYVPVLYERAGFDAPRPEGQQAMFALDVDTFLAHHTMTRERSSDRITVGIGAHSLRAVGEPSLHRIAAAAGDGPLHLHIAEQQREVDECIATNRRRPVQWILENLDVDESWCLVHATHMSAAETEHLAATDAVVCLCPSTEANLGDGLFPLRDFLTYGGRIAIGSDSHVSINPFEELRWLEYGQRLASQTRNVASLEDVHVGRELFTRVLKGGAQAVGAPLAGLQPGAPADLVVLDDGDPMLVGHAEDTLLDALIFSGYRLPIQRVMVHGDWCVIDGEHVDKFNARAGFGAALQRIGASA